MKEMKQEKTFSTELVFILDRSGSMSGLESDTIGGFNSMLEKQQEEAGECRLTTILFDEHVEILHDRLDIKAVKPMTKREYFVRGCTALLDAIGKTIDKISNVQQSTSPEYRAEKVLFIITTDGMENASREFSCDKIKSLINEKKSECEWEFIFLGANIDAVKVAENIGISESNAQAFHNDSIGIQANYRTLAQAASRFRKQERNFLSEDWKEDIQADFENREI